MKGCKVAKERKSESCLPGRERCCGKNYCIMTRFGCAWEMPPLRLPSNFARMMTLLVQVVLFTRKAAPPQFMAMRLVKALWTHSVWGAGPQPCEVCVSE